MSMRAERMMQHLRSLAVISDDGAIGGGGADPAAGCSGGARGGQGS